MTLEHEVRIASCSACAKVCPTEETTINEPGRGGHIEIPAATGLAGGCPKRKVVLCQRTHSEGGTQPETQSVHVSPSSWEEAPHHTTTPLFPSGAHGAPSFAGVAV